MPLTWSLSVAVVILQSLNLWLIVFNFEHLRRLLLFFFELFSQDTLYGFYFFLHFVLKLFFPFLLYYLEFRLRLDQFEFSEPLWLLAVFLLA